MKGYKIIVLAKQVPDTRNVGKDAMKADGTVNRAALPAIFNPEDLNALEQALRIKDKFPGTTITILTMGPGRAAEIIREGMFRGADDGILLTDRAFAGSDTLATSYALGQTLKKHGNYDIIIAGRQAIGGDILWSADQAAVAHHRDFVGDLEDLVHLVRDVDDRHTFAFEVADDAEQMLGFRFGDRRRRLVHHDDRSVAGDRFGNLTSLLL